MGKHKKQHNRPPRIFYDEKGRYLKLNGKKVYIKSNISNQQLVNIVIHNFQTKKSKRRKRGKERGPTNQKMNEFEDLEKLNKDKAGSSGTIQSNNLAKLLFHIAMNQKEKEEREKKEKEESEKKEKEVIHGEIVDGRRVRGLLEGEQQPRGPKQEQQQQMKQLEDDRQEFNIAGFNVRAPIGFAKNAMSGLNQLQEFPIEKERLKKQIIDTEEQSKKAYEDILKKNQDLERQKKDREYQKDIDEGMRKLKANPNIRNIATTFFPIAGSYSKDTALNILIDNEKIPRSTIATLANQNEKQINEYLEDLQRKAEIEKDQRIQSRVKTVDQAHTLFKPEVLNKTNMGKIISLGKNYLGYTGRQKPTLDQALDAIKANISYEEFEGLKQLNATNFANKIDEISVAAKEVSQKQKHSVITTEDYVPAPTFSSSSSSSSTTIPPLEPFSTPQQGTLNIPTSSEIRKVDASEDRRDVESLLIADKLRQEEELQAKRQLDFSTPSSDKTINVEELDKNRNLYYQEKQRLEKTLLDPKLTETQTKDINTKIKQLDSLIALVDKDLLGQSPEKTPEKTPKQSEKYHKYGPELYKEYEKLEKEADLAWAKVSKLDEQISQLQASGEYPDELEKLIEARDELENETREAYAYIGDEIDEDEQEGSGKQDGGLYNDQIDRVMQHFENK
jgi:hypothetical protein